MLMSKKVFIGLNNIANVGLNLKSGFEEIGIVSDFYSAEKTMHKYDYPENSHKKVNRIVFSNNTLLRYLQIILLMIKLILFYSIAVYFTYTARSSTVISAALFGIH